MQLAMSCITFALSRFQAIEKKNKENSPDPHTCRHKKHVHSAGIRSTKHSHATFIFTHILKIGIRSVWWSKAAQGAFEVLSYPTVRHEKKAPCWRTPLDVVCVRLFSSTYKKLVSSFSSRALFCAISRLSMISSP